MMWGFMVIIMTQCRKFSSALGVRFIMDIFEAAVAPGLTHHDWVLVHTTENLSSPVHLVLSSWRGGALLDPLFRSASLNFPLI